MEQSKQKFDILPNAEKVKSANVFFMTMLVLILVSVIFFLAVVNLNNNLNNYDKAYDTLKELFGGANFTPNVSLIRIPALVGGISLLVLVLFSIVTIFFSKIVLKKPLAVRLCAMSVFIIAVIFIFVTAISEFAYAKFSTINAVIGDKNFLSLLPHQNDASLQKMYNYFQLHQYKWTNEKTTWWLEFTRVTLVLIGFMTYQSTINMHDIYAEDVSKNIESSIKRSNVGKNRFVRLINRAFSTNEKTISIWTLIVTMVVLSPQIIYAVMLSINNSDANRLLTWMSVGKNIASNVNGFNNIVATLEKMPNPGNLILVQLPIIVVGLSLATTIAFIFNIVRGWKTDINTFKVQLILSFIEVVATLVFGAISKGYLDNIVKQWNQNNLYEAFSNVGWNNEILQVFALPKFNDQNEISHVWLYGLEYVSEFVMSFAFVGVSYTILTHRVLIITRLRKDERDKLDRDFHNIVKTPDLKATA